LVGAVNDTKMAAGSRAAALAALIELIVASCEAAATDLNAMDGDLVEETAPQILPGLRKILLDFPEDDGTEAWAEGADEDANAPGDKEHADDEGVGMLWDGALDACGRLLAHGGGAVGSRVSLHCMGAELLLCEAWQARHSGLLLQLRLACGEAAAASSGEGEAAVASTYAEAARHFHHSHPRVRWASLEVWARLLAAGLAPSRQAFDSAFESLAALGATDHYLRVRRRGLLVFLLAAAEGAVLTPAHAEPLFRKVLIPQAASPDDDIRDACARIAQGFAGALGWIQPTGEDAPTLPETCAGYAEFTILWQEMTQAVGRGATDAAGMGDQTGAVESGAIEWPHEWR